MSYSAAAAATRSSRMAPQRSSATPPAASSHMEGVDEVWLVNAFSSSIVELWKLGEMPVGPLFLDLENQD